MSDVEFDRIGYWSELKLEIVRKYASAYSTILSAQKAASLYHVYIDAFAGAGEHLAKGTGELVPGSPLNALRVEPPFREYHLVDILPEKIEHLKKLAGSKKNVFVYQGDCNQILLQDVFPRVRYEDFRRGLCILDPYGLDLNWELMRRAGTMRTPDIFINFPVADMNRNVLWRNSERGDARQRDRLNAFWGDDSWKDIAYRTDTTLFGEPEKQSNDVIAEAFRSRLRKVAGFARVPKPLAMRNTRGAIVYYLFFASQKDTAEHIIQDIFRKYEQYGEI